MDLLHAIFFEPIFNALVFFYNILGDMGLAIIALTIVIKVALMPLSNKALRSQRRLQALQPEIARLQKEHKDDRETLARETMAFYQREGVSPASSCLPTLVQIPVLITLFFVFRDAVGPNYQHFLNDYLYGFISRPETLDPHFLGIFDLSAKPTAGVAIILPALAALAQFFQSKMLQPKGAELPAMQKQFLYLFPVLTFVFSATLPAALPLYWLTQSLFGIAQQQYVIRTMPEAEARAEGAKDWNAANPADPVSAKPKPKKLKGKGSANVTVRKRGDK